MTEATHILLVDDDPDDRKLFMEAVKEIAGTIECTVARDGQEAIKLLKNTEGRLPDFIFLDLHMPRYSGKRCLQEIRADDRLKEIPVIIYTTSRDAEESEALREMGAVHFISKPTDPQEIYYVVAQVLEDELRVSGKKNHL